MSRFMTSALVISLIWVTDSNAQTEKYFYESYFKVKNDTDGRMTIWVQYRTQSDDGTWAWYPADPARSEKAIKLTVGAGKSAYVYDGDWCVHAAKVRVWAEYAGGQPATEFKDNDLWLVNKRDDDGKRYYYARQMATYTLVFKYRGEDTPESKEDVKKLQGTWVIVSHRGGGEEQKQFKGRTYTFSGDQFTIGAKPGDDASKTQTLNYSVDATKDPKAFNVILDKKIISLCIYSLEKDRFTFCIPGNSGERPKKFDPNKGTVIILERAKQ